VGGHEYVGELRAVRRVGVLRAVRVAFPVPMFEKYAKE
jgi:hypothetical protein